MVDWNGRLVSRHFQHLTSSQNRDWKLLIRKLGGEYWFSHSTSIPFTRCPLAPLVLPLILNFYAVHV